MKKWFPWGDSLSGGFNTELVSMCSVEVSLRFGRSVLGLGGVSIEFLTLQSDRRLTVGCKDRPV